MSDFRPDMLDAPPVPVTGDVDELPRRRNTTHQRWTPATGWRDVDAPAIPPEAAAGAMFRHGSRCGAMHPNAGFYCTEDPGHTTTNGHAARDEFGHVLRRWMGPDAYLDQDAWDAAERDGADKLDELVAEHNAATIATTGQAIATATRTNLEGPPT